MFVSKRNLAVEFAECVRHLENTYNVIICLEYIGNRMDAVLFKEMDIDSAKSYVLGNRNSPLKKQMENLACAVEDFTV